MPRISQTDKGAHAHDVLAGVRSHLARGRTYRMGGKDYTSEEVIAVFQTQIDALHAIHVARAQLAAAVARERALVRGVKRMEAALREYVACEMGQNAEAFASFGWKLPAKPGPKTLRGKVEGARKGKATRAARGTLGKRQRLTIRGRVDD